MQETLTLRLSGGPTAPARARTALRSLDRTVGELRERVELLVSELVSNSVLHAQADQITLHAKADPGCVRVEVSDPGPGFEVGEQPRGSFAGAGGFGLQIVDTIANRWGVARGSEARVWFEIDRESREGPRRRMTGRPDASPLCVS